MVSMRRLVYSTHLILFLLLHHPHYRSIKVLANVIPGSALQDEPCPPPCSCRFELGQLYVECEEQDLRVVPSEIPSQTIVLNLAGNPLTTLGESVFSRSSATSPQQLYLTRCSLTLLHSEAFVGMNNLRYLYLEVNELSHIPTHTLHAVARLQVLVLSGNPIKSIKENAFAGLKHLKRIELDRCGISTISPTAFVSLPTLQNLLLMNNELEALDHRLLQSMEGHLLRLDLHGNPWSCNCTLRPIRQWFTTHRVGYAIPPRCRSPSAVAGLTWDELKPINFTCPAQILQPSRRKNLRQRARSSVFLLCPVYADPPADVKWMRYTRQDVIPPQPHPAPSPPTTVSTHIIITNPPPPDHVVLNPINPIPPPRISDNPPSLHRRPIIPGAKHNVTCTGLLNKNCVLHLDGVRGTDSGEYVCVAENNGGRVTMAITLEVYGDDIPHSQPADMIQAPPGMVPDSNHDSVVEGGGGATQQPQATTSPILEGYGGAIAAAAILAAILTLTCCALCAFCYRRKQNRKRQQEEDNCKVKKASGRVVVEREEESVEMRDIMLTALDNTASTPEHAPLTANTRTLPYKTDQNTMGNGGIHHTLPRHNHHNHFPTRATDTSASTLHHHQNHNNHHHPPPNGAANGPAIVGVVRTLPWYEDVIEGPATNEGSNSPPRAASSQESGYYSYQSSQVGPTSFHKEYIPLARTHIPSPYIVGQQGRHHPCGATFRTPCAMQSPSSSSLHSPSSAGVQPTHPLAAGARDSPSGRITWSFNNNTPETDV